MGHFDNLDDSRWGRLTMAQKAELMGLYIRNGVTSLDKMKEHYNSFDDGGSLGKKKPKYKEWVKGVDKRFLSDDYNLEAAYNELDFAEMEAWRRNPSANHLPDTYKLPNHITFSEESIDPVANMRGGKWVGDKFYPSEVNRMFHPNVYKYKGVPYVEVPYSERGMLPAEMPKFNGGIKFSERGHLFGKGGSPDYDPTHPYHYHNDNGEKVVVTEEEWKKYKDDPAFAEYRKAIEAERAAHPGPEYEVDKNFVADLRDAVNTARRNWTGKGFMNWRNYGSALPEGYTIDDAGIVYDANGNAYVQPQFDYAHWRNSDFTRKTEEPVNIVFNQGKPIEQSVPFYPIDMKMVEKQPLPVNKTIDIGKAMKENAYTPTYYRLPIGDAVGWMLDPYIDFTDNNGHSEKVGDLFMGRWYTKRPEDFYRYWNKNDDGYGEDYRKDFYKYMMSHPKKGKTVQNVIPLYATGGHLYQEGGDKDKWWRSYQQQPQIEVPYLPEDYNTYSTPTLNTVKVKASRPEWHKYIQPAEWKAFRKGKRGFETVDKLKELAEHRRTGKSQFMYEMMPRIRYDNREMRDLKQRILNYQELFEKEQGRYTKNVQNERRRHPIVLTDKEVDEMLENYNFLEKNLNQYKNDVATLNKHINDKYKSNSFKDQLYRYAGRHFPNIYNLLTGNIADITTKEENEKLEFSGIGSDIFSLDHNVIRVKPNTKQSTALFNEFIETKNPSIHLAKDYKEGKIKTFGDSNIPVKNIYLFQGIEDGKFKAGPIDNFKDSTLVYPVRNIKKDFITPIKNISIDRDGDKNDYDFKRLVSYLNLQLPVIGYRQFKSENQQNIKLQRFNERVKSTEPQSTISVIDIDDRTYPVTNLNASILDNKTVIANPSGGLMIGRFQDMTDTQLDSLNTYLQQHPSWIIRNDLGSFDQYKTNNPTLEEYLKQFHESPNPYDPNIYAVGTVTPNIGFPKINTEYANGGKMLIAKTKRNNILSNL